MIRRRSGDVCYRKQETDNSVLYQSFCCFWFCIMFKVNKLLQIVENKLLTGMPKVFIPVRAKPA